MSDHWVNLYPIALFGGFLLFLYSSKRPDKYRFAVQALSALGIAVILAHVNRWFHLWPAHRLFPSAHMTFCLGVSLSLGMLRPWTLLITLPLLLPFGKLVISQHFHSLFDLVGAVPLVLVVYGVVHLAGNKQPTLPPLDSESDSP